MNAPAKKKKRKPAGNRRGKPPSTNQVRVISTHDGSILRFTLSDDVVQRLVALHDSLFKGLLPSTVMQHRMRHLRMEFVRFVDLAIPAVLMRIEQPTFDPKGVRLHQVKGGKRWQCQIAARRIGVRAGLPAHAVDYYETEDTMLRGVIVNFADEDMIHLGEKVDVRKAFNIRASDPDEDLRA